MIKYVLWDIDGTLLNFDIAENNALAKTFIKFNLGELSEKLLLDYKNINNKYRKMLEEGTITRAEVLEGRFREFFDKYNLSHANVGEFNMDFQKELGKTYEFNPNGLSTVLKLKENYKQYAVTNGSLIAQEAKLKGTDLINILDGVFISEILGFEKPSHKYFDIVFQKIGSKNPNEYIIIGDSLTSDMLGGVNSGIKTIWFNPNDDENILDIDIDYEIDDLSNVMDILDNL